MSTARFVLVTGHTFGDRALQGLVSSEAYQSGALECSLVVQLARQLSGATVGFTVIDALAEGAAIPLLETSDGSLRSIRDDIVSARPDYLLVIGWSRLVAPEVLSVPRSVNQRGAEDPVNAPQYGSLGMHPSPLPVGRGRAPIPWTIIKRLKSTAVTTFFLEESADSGSIAQQHPILISPHETATSLFLRIADLHFHAAAELAGLLATRAVPMTPQREDLATIWPIRRPADSEVDFSQSVEEVLGFVRALQWPYPQAFVTHGALQYHVSSAQPHPGEAIKPGNIRPGAHQGEVIVDCLDGRVLLRLSSDTRYSDPPASDGSKHART